MQVVFSCPLTARKSLIWEVAFFIVLLLLLYSLRVFHTSISWWSFTGEGDKIPQISRTHLNILTDLNNAVVWMVSIRPLLSISSTPLPNHKQANYNWYQRYLHIPQFSYFSGKVYVFFGILASFDFLSMVKLDRKKSVFQIFFIFCLVRSGLGHVVVSENPSEYYPSISGIILSGTHSPHRCVSTYSSFVLVWFIYLCE